MNNKAKKLKLATQITVDFYKSEYFRGEATMEEDMKLFIENNEKYKKLIEELKKGE